MYEIKVVKVAVESHGGYSYYEVRVVKKLVGGGYYQNSKGCTILWRSGELRGTVRATKRAEEIAATYREQLAAEQAEAARLAASEDLREHPATAAGVQARVSLGAVTAGRGW